MIRIAFILRAPEIGGAERQLVELVRGLDRQRFHCTILPFYQGGSLRPDLENIPGVAFHDVGKSSRWDMVGFLWRLRRAIREVRADIVYGCLGVANETALLVGRLEHAKVIWRLGASYNDLSWYDWTARPMFRVGKFLSRFPDRIVVNSHAGLEYHRREGYDVSRMDVIPNGFDTTLFARDRDSGAAVRREFGIADDAPVVGISARLDPIKNHTLFLDAAARVAARHPRVRFVCVGGGPPDVRERLAREAAERGLAERVVWAGPRRDMRAIYNAFDIHCLCSLAEGLPNAVGEAMACELPNVVTDVGDAKRLVGDAGRAVPSNDREALAGALDAMLALPPEGQRALGECARRRIVEEYQAPLLIQRTSELMVRLANGSSRTAP